MLDQGVGVIPWSPLARGVLAGNRTREGERRTTRANSDAFGDSLYRGADFDVVDRPARWPPSGAFRPPGGAVLAAAPARQ